MADIVTRLRDTAHRPALYSLCDEAADEIELLGTEIMFLRIRAEDMTEYIDALLAEIKALKNEAADMVEVQRAEIDRLMRDRQSLSQQLDMMRSQL